MKKRCNDIETIVICCVFIVGMIIVGKIVLVNSIGQIINRDINHFEQKYPFQTSKIEQVQNKIEKMQSLVNQWCTSFFPYANVMNETTLWIKKNVMMYDLKERKDNVTELDYIQEALENVIDFSSFLQEKDIPFLYVQTPSADSIEYFNGRIDNIENHIVANRGRIFTEELEKKDIDVLNLAEQTKGRGYTFDASGHWFPEDALKGSQLICEKLNCNYGFSFNTEKYDKKYFSDILENNQEIKNKTSVFGGYEYEMLVPMELGNYELIYAEKETMQGNFIDVFLSEKEKWKAESSVAYHNMFTMVNSLVYNIHNLEPTTNQGKRVLILSDSFDWPVSAFLSLEIEYIDTIHNASFDGSIQNYIEQTKPDIVIICYNDAEFYDEYTQEAFYLK